MVGEKERGWEGFTDLHPNDMPTKKSTNVLCDRKDHIKY